MMPQDLHRKLFLGSTFALAAFPILSFSLRSIVLIIWSLSGIFLFYKNKRASKGLNSNPFSLIILVLPYLLLVFSMLYSENKAYGYKRLSEMLSMVIIPFILFLNRGVLSRKSFQKILVIFCVAVGVLVFYQILFSLYHWETLSQDITVEELKSNGYFLSDTLSNETILKIKARRFRNFIINLVASHPTYQGLWISFTCFIILKWAMLKRNFMQWIGAILFTGVLIAWMFLISARMPIIAMIISLFAVGFFYFKNSKKKTTYFFFGLLVVTIPVLLFFSNHITVRFKEIYNTGLGLLSKDTHVKDMNSTSLRNGIYYCSFQVVKDNPLFGVGIGDAQDALNKCYKNKIGSDIYTWRNYNSHNQYLFFWMSSGLLGLISFLIVLFYSFQKAMLRKDILFLGLLSISSFIFLTENLLVRSDGLIFFYFFISLYWFHQSQNELKGDE